MIRFIQCTRKRVYGPGKFCAFIYLYAHIISASIYAYSIHSILTDLNSNSNGSFSSQLNYDPLELVHLVESWQCSQKYELINEKLFSENLKSYRSTVRTSSISFLLKSKLILLVAASLYFCFGGEISSTSSSQRQSCFPCWLQFVCILSSTGPANIV